MPQERFFADAVYDAILFDLTFTDLSHEQIAGRYGRWWFSAVDLLASIFFDHAIRLIDTDSPTLVFIQDAYLESVKNDLTKPID